jgi:alpha-mannosidase
MVFELERIERIVKDLESLVYSDIEPIVECKTCIVTYKHDINEINESSKWKNYTTGNLWGGYDKHQWFKTTVNMPDWKEKNILLKVVFPVDINSSKATYEIQYGNFERETHSNTSWDIAKFEVCAHK